MTGRPTWARRLTAIVLVIAIGALVLTIRNIGPAKLLADLRRIGWWWLAVIPMEIWITSLDSFAIRAFASPARPKWRTALFSQLAGRAVNVVTPSGNLGELVKMSMLTETLSESRAVSTILLYNVVSFSVEMLIMAAAAPFVALLMPMSAAWRVVILGIGVGCFAISVGLYILVQRGMLGSVGRLVLSKKRFARWEPKLRGIDEKMQVVSGARRRHRALGIGAVVVSRLSSMVLSLMILHAVGEPITLTFVAAWTVGSNVIYFVSTLVPMGLGVSEGGYYGFYRALREDPARGVTLVIARRAVTIAYAAIGLILVATSETVKRAREGEQTPAGPGGAMAPVSVVTLAVVSDKHK